MSIVLASGSPRRREILSMLGVSDFKIIPAHGEECAPDGASPEEIVMLLSAAKAKEVASQCENEDTVIAADTIVYHNGEVYGKPADEADAQRMLRSLSGCTHSVYTGLSIISHGELIQDYVCTKVEFRKITADEIKKYITTGEPMDKAGAYAIQGKASIFISGIIGDYYNVVGLPVCRLEEMLKKQGVKLI